MKIPYDSSWDLIMSKRGNVPKCEDVWNKKCQEWKTRDWKKWLEKNLVFPFTVERKEDEDVKTQTS
jgi:hypothetical protein